jgi:hypothetical protein
MVTIRTKAEHSLVSPLAQRPPLIWPIGFKQLT